MRFNAAVLHEVGKPLAIERVELGALQPFDVLVRVHASGLCHTDLEVMQGTEFHPLDGQRLANLMKDCCVEPHRRSVDPALWARQ